jgi:hypothetical protein
VPAAAIVANAAGPAEPRHADPIADLEAIDLGASFDHDANDLVAGHQWQLWVGQFPVEDMEIGAAHCAGPYRDQHFAWRRDRRRQLAYRQGAMRCDKELSTQLTNPLISRGRTPLCRQHSLSRFESPAANNKPLARCSEFACIG